MFDFRHLAVFVSDLRRAEQYYQDLFRMELIGREAEGEDGETYALPPRPTVTPERPRATTPRRKLSQAAPSSAVTISPDPGPR